MTNNYCHKLNRLYYYSLSLDKSMALRLMYKQNSIMKVITAYIIFHYYLWASLKLQRGYEILSLKDSKMLMLSLVCILLSFLIVGTDYFDLRLL